MLTIPLSQLKHQLEEMLQDLQLLATALKQLRDLLPEQSDKRVTVLAMLGRLNDANKKSLRGTLDNTALQTEYNAIRSDFSDFVRDLEEVDFGAQSKSSEATSAEATAAKGSVLYRIPDTMPLKQETECVVRIAIDEDAIVEDIVIDDQTVLKSLSRVSDLMQVELGDPAKQPVFAIRSTSDSQQLITPEGYTQWFFYVEPLRVGVHSLEVKVSVLELAFNAVHRKELVFRETINIVTESAAAAEESEESVPQTQVSGSGFKKSGETFSFGDGQNQKSSTETRKENDLKGATVSPPPIMPPFPEASSESIESPSLPAEAEAENSSRSGNRMRGVAFFMAFLVFGSTATWALTPAETRDWWVASIIEDDATAYASYIKEHPTSPYVEKAHFYRAERSGRLADLRDYQEKFPSGKFEDKVNLRLYALETKSLDSIRQNPRPANIQQFAKNFPETQRLPEVKQAAETRIENRKELLAAVEDAYVTAVRRKPTKQKVDDYLHDFPQTARLQDVTEAVAAKPEVMNQVQIELEEAHLKKMEKDPTATQAQEFLQQFPEPIKKQEFEKVLDKKPVLKKEVISKMRKTREAREAKERKMLEGG